MQKLLQIMLATLVSTTASGRAFVATPKAQNEPDQTVTPWIGASTYYGVELGVKAGWLIANPGFVPQINNSVFIEGSVLVSESGQLFVAPLLQWCFHLHPEWTVYGEAGAELGTRFGDDDDDDDDKYFNPRRNRRGSGLVLQGGAVWRFKPDMGLRLEHDLSHNSFRVGLLFPW